MATTYPIGSSKRAGGATGAKAKYGGGGIGPANTHAWCNPGSCNTWVPEMCGYQALLKEPKKTQMPWKISYKFQVYVQGVWLHLGRYLLIKQGQY
jgi:hypothetical protein